MPGRSDRVRTDGRIKTHRKTTLAGRSSALRYPFPPFSSRRRTKSANPKAPLAPFAKNFKPKKVNLALSSSLIGSVVRRRSQQKKSMKSPENDVQEEQQ